MVVTDDHAGRTRSTRKTVSRGRLVFRRFFRRRLATVGLVVVAAPVRARVRRPVLHQVERTLDLDPTALLQPPSGTHWFGTTQIGSTCTR